MRVAPAHVLQATLATLAIARIASAFVPSMALWGLNVARFVPAPWAVTLLALPLVALVPAFARPVARALDRVRLDRVSWRLACALAASALVLVLPDRVWLTGDFLGRQFSLASGEPALAWYTHSMPLDTALHERLGRLLVHTAGLSPNAFGRVLGALEAGLLAWLAPAFALELGLAGVRAIAAAALVFWGGWLALFTGYNKAISDLVVLVAAFGVLGMRVLRADRGHVRLACVLAVALFVHRYALALFPAFAVVAAVALRRTRGVAAGTRARQIAAYALPVVAFAAALPRLLTILQRYDRALLVPIATHAAGPDTRALDAFDVLLSCSPVGLALLPLALVTRPGRRAEAAFFAAMLVAFLAVLAGFYPPEGLFRMGDIFAPAGLALALCAAWLMAGVAATPGARTASVAITIGAACPALLALVHATDADRGLARVRAFLDEPPPRAAEVRASAHEFLGFRLVDLDRPAAAADAFARAAEVVPSPRVLRQWASAAMLAGDTGGATDATARIVARDPANVDAWRQLAALRMQRGDLAGAAEALRAVVRLAPGDVAAQQALARIGGGAAPPESARR